MQMDIVAVLMNKDIFLPARSMMTVEKHVAMICTPPTITDDVLELSDEPGIEDPPAVEYQAADVG